MADICGDNRFEIIARAKMALLEGTNIDTCPDEMAVIDDILFRCWQMGWLDRYNDSKTEPSFKVDRIGDDDPTIHAITHLQKVGWLQEHDRALTESSSSKNLNNCGDCSMIELLKIKTELNKWRDLIGDDIADAIISNLEEEVDEEEPSTYVLNARLAGYRDGVEACNKEWLIRLGYEV